MKTFDMRKFYKQIKKDYNNNYAYIAGLCNNICCSQDDEIYILWYEYWNKINTDKRFYVTNYFEFSVCNEEATILRFMVLIDFCNKYNIEIIHSENI